VSKALWIPTVWLGIACSRPISTWFDLGAPGPDTADQVLEGNPTDRLILSLLLALGVIVLVARRKKVIRLCRANCGVIAFVIYCAISLFWSDYPDVAFKRWVRVLGDVVMIWIVLSEQEPVAAVRRLLARLTYVLIPLSILFIKYYPQLGVHYSPWGGSGDYAGVANNKNSLGAICLCLGVAALWRLLLTFRAEKGTGLTKQVTAQLASLAMVLYLFGRINAMTATMTLMMASVLLLVANVRFVVRNPMIVHVFITVMLFISSSIVFLGASSDALAAIGRNPTLTDRTEVWRMILSLVQNPLLGTGFESFWLGPRLQKMWSRYWWHPAQAHNGYLETYINLGWVGVILLTIVLANGYRSASTAWRQRHSFGDLRLAYILAGLIFNFTEAAFFRMQAPAWICLLLAVVDVPAVAKLKAEVFSRDSSRRPNGVRHKKTQFTGLEVIG